MGTVAEKVMFITSDGQSFEDRLSAENFEAFLTSHGYDRIKDLYLIMCKYGFSRTDAGIAFSVLRKAAGKPELRDSLLKVIWEEEG
jgi:hypothetical protein